MMMYVVIGKGVQNGKFYIGLDHLLYRTGNFQSIREIMQLEMIYNFKSLNKEIYVKNKESYYHDVF